MTARDVLVVPTESVYCKSGVHDCPGRGRIGRELHVCVCACHDDGDRRSIIVPEASVPEDEREVERLRMIGAVGGKKGGPARARNLKPGKRKAIAQLAAAIRWGHPEKRLDALRELAKEE